MRKLFVLAAFVGVLFASSVANANLVTLADGNSEADFLINDPNYLDGMVNWRVNGVDHMYYQWFFFQLNGGAVNALDALGTAAYNVYGGRILDATYGGAGGLEVNIVYTLAGGAPNQLLSDMGEVLRIKNRGTSAITLDFYQYCDFDLDATTVDNSVKIALPKVTQTSDQMAVSETTILPAVTSYRAGNFATVYNDVIDGGGLINDAGPYYNDDLGWAFHWRRVLAPNGALLISKDKQLMIPAPGAVVLGMLGLGLVGWAKRRWS